MAHAFQAAALTAILFGLTSPSLAQDESADPLRIRGMVPSGLRTSVTESWGTLSFTISNPGESARDLRVLVFFPARPDLQFGRDVWAPAGASVTTWVPFGPAIKQPGLIGREVEYLLYDRTGGQDRLILPPGEQRVRSRAIPYRRREPTTAIMLDEPGMADDPRMMANPESKSAQAFLFAQTLREAGGFPEYISIVHGGFLPATAAAFDGIDHLILASNRIGADPVGQQALRHWLEQGGRIWIMLDQVDPEVIAPIVGGNLDFQIVDRVGLTTVHLQGQKRDAMTGPPRDFEEPVDFVRVLTSPSDRVIHTVNGWPASFTRQIGRGKVLFTTLGGRAWYRPRTERDSGPRYQTLPQLPIALIPLGELAAELKPKGPVHPFNVDELRPLLTEEIGYHVIDRRVVIAILGAFILGLLALAVGLRRSRHPELVGWLAPVGAIAAAALFVVLAESSRQAVPPTHAVAEVADVVPGNGEAAVSGLFAMYRPASGAAPLSSRDGGLLELDAEGLEGQTRRRVQTDMNSWHWENLAVPAGVRFGPFRAARRIGGMAAVARFTGNGLEGRLPTDSFRNLTDAIVTTSARQSTALRFNPDGTFTARSEDSLASGQFIAGAVLGDRQQRRQDVYRKLLTGDLPEHLQDRDLLLAWAEPVEIPFDVAEGSRASGTSLLIVPLEFEQSPPDSDVKVPPAFIPFNRIRDKEQQQPTLESTYAIDMHLRFQLPRSVLPMQIQRATLVARVRAPGWKVAISGFENDRPVQKLTVESPVEPIRLDLAGSQLLHLDDQGGLHFNLAITHAGGGNDLEANPGSGWKIESLTLEAAGRTAAKGTEHGN